jgi:hypothetical protein
MRTATAKTTDEYQTAVPRCANCGVEIPWRPTFLRGSAYCCGGCAQGGPCYCSYDVPALEPRAHFGVADRLRSEPRRSGRGAAT